MSNAPIHPAGSSEAFNYIAEANVTASNNYHGHAVSHHEAFGIITSSVMALNQLDKLKKALFYGRNLEDFSTGNEVRASMATWPEIIQQGNPNKGEFLLHAIVGIATESGELLEALLKSVDRADPKEFDEVNFVEELGDVLWYVAIGLGAIGVSFEEVQRRNIAKLRHRFPQKFTEYDANNRDLFGERKILEMHGACIPAGYRMPLTDGEGHVIEVTDSNGYVKLAPGEKPTVDLENWIQVGNVLIGDVIGHPRLGNAGGCRTSAIVRMDEANGICETKNTVYRLGRKA